MIEQIQEEIDNARKLLNDGKEEEALEFVKNLEKRKNLSDLERVECLILKGFIFNEMGLHDDWLELSTLILQEGERLKKPEFIAYGHFSRVWALFLGQKNVDLLEPSRTLISQLEELRKYASKPEIEQIEGILTLQKAYLYSAEGNLDSSIKLFEESIKKPAVWISHLTPLGYLRVGLIYLTKGELIHALENFEKGLSLLKGDSYNTQINKGMLLDHLGDLHFQQNNLDLSLEYYQKSLEFYKENNFIMLIGSVFDGLIKVSLAKGNFEQAKQYLDSFKQVNEQYKVPTNIRWYQLSKTRLLKISSRFHDWVEAVQILKELIEDSEIVSLGTLSPHNPAIIELCDFLLKELQLTSNSDILGEIDLYIEKLRNNSIQQNSYSTLSETMLLQAKIALINMKIEDAKILLKRAQSVAEDHDLFLLAQKISSEHDTLLDQSDLWEEFKKNEVSLSDRLKLASIDGVLDRLKGKRAIEPPDLVDEQPVLLIIISEGGTLLFSYTFTDEWKKDEDLFSNFLSAFSSFSDEFFSQGLDRVKFGEDTIIMQPIDSFSVCYLFKGQAYPAKQKLTKFIEKIQDDTTTWETFQKFSKTSQVAEIQDIPIVEDLLTKIFKI
ncbi:MAG: tetratricopeptide repeat protein [Promethearchaeota archaeon]|jgi:tetratricopeptide (TPR) repeat protein